MNDEKAKPEHPKVYKVQIDKDDFEFTQQIVTGRDLLVKAGKNPPENFAIYAKVKGGQPVRIELDEKVDLADPGKEKFVTLPLDQTEGLGARRDFSLPAEDHEWLDGQGLPYELVATNGIQRVVIYDWAVCEGYTVATVAVNVRIDPGYPDCQIDMAYFHPPLVRVSGRVIDATCDDPFDGKNWQRWSRHRTPANPWRPGVDNLATHMAQVQDWLRRELKKV